MSLGEKLNRVTRVEDVSTLAVAWEATKEQIDAEDDASIQEECPESVALLREEHDNHMLRELMLNHEKRELLERESNKNTRGLVLCGEHEMIGSALAMNSGTSAAVGVPSYLNLKDSLFKYGKYGKIDTWLIR